MLSTNRLRILRQMKNTDDVLNLHYVPTLMTDNFFVLLLQPPLQFFKMER